jgi:LPS export ABC transporter protein LptC
MILERFLCKTHRLQGITTIIWIVVMLLLCNTSCNKEKKEVVDVSFDPETTYTLRTTDVSTLISDSGITRYRLNAKEWLVFGKAKEPYWYFPKGIYVEKFDTLFQSEASIQADTAYNYEKKSLWKLVGNVKIESLEGTRFETSLLYWDQKEEKIYSDKYIRIEEEDKVITGIGFESNQDMSQYKIFDSQGVFPVSESANDTISETVSLDSVIVQKEEFVPEYESDVKQEIVKKNERKLVPKILKPLEKEIR